MIYFMRLVSRKRFHITFTVVFPHLHSTLREFRYVGTGGPFFLFQLGARLRVKAKKLKSFLFAFYVSSSIFRKKSNHREKKI